VRKRVRARDPDARHLTLAQGCHYPHVVAREAPIDWREEFERSGRIAKANHIRTDS